MLVQPVLGVGMSSSAEHSFLEGRLTDARNLFQLGVNYAMHDTAAWSTGGTLFIGTT